MDVEQYLQSIRSESRMTRLWRRLKTVIPIFSLLVVLGIFWWLKLTGITMAGEAFCGMGEHVHAEGCTERILICTEPVQTTLESCELPEHSHDAQCYSQSLLCSEEHAHTDSCYEALLNCQIPEHAHSEECQTGHIHSDTCYTTNVICQLPEHVHEVSCYSDLSADVETDEDWENTLSGLSASLSGGERIEAVARSQLGYTESEQNFQVDAEGVRRGITRYGQWYGNPYGDWSGMFTSFCLHYGGFDLVSANAGAESMYLDFLDAQLYWAATEYTPQVGDVVFLDLNANGTADTTAIVTGVDTQQILVIQGDLENRVAETAYAQEDPAVLGYGMTQGADSVQLMASAGSNVIGRRTDYSGSVFNGDESFILYAQGSDGNYYAMDGNAQAVQIYIADDGSITTDHATAEDLYWTFAYCGTYDNQQSYYIQNIGSGMYLHPYADSNTSHGAILSGRWESAIYPNGTGVRFRGARQNAYAVLSENSSFTNAGTLNGATTFYLGTAPSRRAIWFDGTLGGLKSHGGSLDKCYYAQDGDILKLPESWQTPEKYHYVIQGWYDVTNHKYYLPGEEITVNGNAVFYPDWVAASYDIGQFNSRVSNTVSTNSFITTRVFDYNMLFNLLSESVSVTANAAGHSETWNLLDSGTVPYNGQESINFIMRDWDSGGDISYPNNTNSDNTSAAIHAGLYTPQLGQILFGTDNGFDPVTQTGIIGKTYLGSGDHLFQYASDPEHAYYGYYYYDSQYHAASYNQSAQRFYVYDYLEKTADSTSGEGQYSDFVPMNSPYVNTNDKDIPIYTYNGINGEYAGVNHFQYDTGYSNTTNVGTNFWFGMSMETKFYLPDVPGTVDANGTYGNLDMYGKQMHFKFSGDDDVWVLVDGEVVLDIGGIHGIQGGDINFSTGVVTVDGGGSYNLSGIEAGEHTLTVYYLERGGSQSNCAMYFNLAPRFSLDIRKEDVLTQELLDGTQFTVYTDEACTQPAELWISQAAHDRGEATTNTFTVTNGIASMWGLGSGKTYYIRETKPPNAADYSLASGVIRLTLDKKGLATYDVQIVDDVDGSPVSNGFTVHGTQIDLDAQKMFIVITNAQDWVEDTTTVQVHKRWDDALDHSGDYVTVYLNIEDPDGTVRRIREIILSDENDWSYTWTNLPEFYSDGVTEVKYGVEEAYVAGYYATVERMTELVVTSTTWAEAYTFQNGQTYLLITSSGCLATTSSTADTLRWMGEEEAKTSPLALWTATVSGSNIRFTNEAGQILSFNYATSSSNRYFYATSGSATYQNMAATDTGTGFRLSCKRSNRSYYFSSIGSNGRASATTSTYNALVFTPMTRIQQTTQSPVEDWGYTITNTAIEKETSMTVHKQWVTHVGGAELYEQLQVTVKLLANGVDTGRTVTLSLKNGWTDTFTGLPYEDASGNPITYTVQESWNTNDWVASYGEIVASNGDPPTYDTTITNTYRWGNGVELPSTGGYGRTPWILSAMGIFLVTLVLGCVFRRERKGGKEQTS